MAFYVTFLASLKSLGTAMKMAGVGFYLHRRGFVSNEGKRTLALLSQQVLFPLFLFTEILYCNQDWSDEECPDVTKSIQEAWMLLIWPLYVVGSGLFIGWVVAYCTKAPKQQLPAIMATCGFANATGLPVTLLAVIHSNFPTNTDLGRVDPSLFLSVYLLLYPALQWGLGGWLLSPDIIDDNYDEQEIELERGEEEVIPEEEFGVDRDKQQLVNENRFLLPAQYGVYRQMHDNVLNNTMVNKLYKSHRHDLSRADEVLYVSEVNLQQLVKEQLEIEKKELLLRRMEREANAVDNCEAKIRIEANGLLSPLQRSRNSSYGATEDGSSGTSCSTMLLDSTPHHTKYLRSDRNATMNFDTDTVWQTIYNVMERCFQPPVIGSLLGILAAMIPHVRGLFIEIIDPSSHAPLEWFYDGIYTVGQVAIPVNMLVLGCNLSWNDDTKKKTDDTAQPLKNHESGLFSTPTSIGIVVGKLICQPLIGIISTMLLKKYVLTTIPEDIDGSFFLVMMIVFLTPTANNVMIMVELSGSNAKKGLARVIALQYVFAPFILSITITICVAVATS